jgi:plasmid stability protein
MKTTLELPDDLVRAIKIRAVKENRKLKDAIADLLRRGLSGPSSPRALRHRVKLPLVRCSRDARPDQEMTPERVARVLLDEEAEGRVGPLR